MTHLLQAVFALCLLSCSLLCSADSGIPDDRVTALSDLRSKSKDAIIVLAGDDAKHFLLSKKRPYDVLVLLGSQQMAGNQRLRPQEQRVEFAYAAQAYARGGDADKVFFVELMFEDNQELFGQIQVNQLPHAFRLSPKVLPKSSGRVEIPEDDKVMGKIAQYPWPAEQLAEFVKGRTGHGYDAIDRPSIFKHRLFPLFALVLLAGMAVVGWRIYTSEWIQHPIIWTLGSLAVYLFSTSGGMYNIIRGIPMYIFRDGKIQYWLPGRQGQLGAEGLIMGASYIAISVLLVVLTRVAPAIESIQLRKLVGTVTTAASAMLVFMVFEGLRWKTGHSLRTFF